MSYPRVVGVPKIGNLTGTAGNTNVARPTGLVAGRDELILVLIGDPGGADPVPPAGFVALLPRNASYGGIIDVSWWHKPYTGTEADPLVVTSVTQNASVLAAFGLAGFKRSEIVDPSGVGATTAATWRVNGPSVDPRFGSGLLLGLYAGRASGGITPPTPSVPAGMTSIIGSSDGAAPSGVDWAMRLAWQQISGAPTGIRTSASGTGATGSATEMFAELVVIEGMAGGGIGGFG